MPERKTVRLRDVAREAGVSIATASRALARQADEVPVRPETRARVDAAARHLGYRPNAMARGLKLSEARALGLVVPSLRNPVLAGITHGAFERAWERGFVVLLAEDTGEESSQRAYTRLVQEGRIDGLLVASARIGQTVLGYLEGAAVPCVFVNRRRARSGRNVVMREEDAGRIAARHFLDLGHTRLAVLAGPTDLDTARRRMRGFVAEAQGRGVQAHVIHAAYEEPAAREAMARLLGERPRPTAIFISNLNQAIGAAAAVRELQIGVPAELSLIACDEDPIVDFLGVPVTTIKMPLTQLGAAAVDAVLDQIGGARPRNVTVPDEPVLVDRRATAPPARRA